MELIDQHTKGIMEECKRRARDAGLKFDDESLEYIVTNRDLLELSPKLMIPTLYDYWVHDVEVLKEKGRYELYPSNPYETVINTKPAISFYNDNNPDWLNVMIFYHVIAHIDFFQNNTFFRHTWDYDFTGRALSDKRMISKFRSEKGRWVDYVIEFSRGIDNLANYYSLLSELNRPAKTKDEILIDFYFDIFLQSEKKIHMQQYLKEIDKYNTFREKYKEYGNKSFFAEVRKKYPEFDTVFDKYKKDRKKSDLDLFQYLMEYSQFLKKEENTWMKSVMQVVRNTSLFFQPQIRTKILNEGWASYWHETLFLSDDRIKGHEVEFARVNSGVTTLPRVGINPYALGMRLFYYIERNADQGRFTYDFQRLSDTEERKTFDKKTNNGREYIFKVRENFSDHMFINHFLDQDFINENKLFVAGKRLNQNRMVWEYFVKSRNAEDYREMILSALYHPPHIEIEPNKTTETTLYLVHKFEEKQLVAEYIPNTMMGIEYLWGGPVKLETTEMIVPSSYQGASLSATKDDGKAKKIQYQRVLYTMENKKLTKKNIIVS